MHFQPLAPWVKKAEKALQDSRGRDWPPRELPIRRFGCAIPHAAFLQDIFPFFAKEGLLACRNPHGLLVSSTPLLRLQVVPGQGDPFR
jgi:hypothetical protein